jgi:hypothetical protein
MFDSLILLFIFTLNKKKYFLSKKSEQGKGWTTDPPCSELIEVKPCLKRGSTIQLRMRLMLLAISLLQSSEFQALRL